jgi:hypothetical protein
VVIFARSNFVKVLRGRHRARWFIWCASTFLAHPEKFTALRALKDVFREVNNDKKGYDATTSDCQPDYLAESAFRQTRAGMGEDSDQAQ